MHVTFTNQSISPYYICVHISFNSRLHGKIQGSANFQTIAVFCSSYWFRKCKFVGFTLKFELIHYFPPSLVGFGEACFAFHAFHNLNIQLQSAYRQEVGELKPKRTGKATKYNMWTIHLQNIQKPYKMGSTDLSVIFTN